MQVKKYLSSPSSFWRSRTVLDTGVATVILIAVITVLVLALHFRQVAETKVTIATQNIANTLQLSIEGLIEKMDVSLQASTDEINRQLATGKVDLPSTVTLLERQQERLPGVAFLRGANEHGEIIYGPGVVSPPANVSARDYFIRLRDDPTAGLVIGKPVIGRIAQKWVWLFARRINKPDGTFGGVVFAAIQLDKVEALFSSIQLGADDSIALRGPDLGLIARYLSPSTNKVPIGDKHLSIPFVDALKANPQAGTYISGATSIDGISRMHSYRRNAKYGFIVNVGVSNKAILAEWYKQVWAMIGLLAIFIAALLTFSKLIRRAWLHQDQMVASLQASQQSLREAQVLARLGHYVYDLRTRLWTGSTVLDDIFGIDSDYPHDLRHWLELVVEESREEILAHLNSVIERHLPFDRTYCMTRFSDGKERWVHATGRLRFDEQGNPVAMAGTVQDISESKAAADENLRLAFYDPLTRLPNRRLLLDRLQQALASSARNRRQGALMFIDLDNFKTLNDTLGHDSGDLLLQQVAERLISCMRKCDTVARLGGDEFVVMLEDLSEESLEAAARTKTVGEKILTTLDQPYQLAGHEYHTTASIGATLFSGQQQVMEELMKQADISMYQAKKAGRNTLRFFDAKMQDTINTRVALEGELRKALETQQFHLHYQIQIDSLSRPVGAEALIRWIHPERGLVSPLEFIPLAEETNLILTIGQWVLETACARLKAWQQEALTRDLVLAVNVSARQFRQEDFVAQVQAVAQRHAINPMLLKLELTEGLLLENIEDTIEKMGALNEIGVQFSLDDFGTGYSSLQYLKRLPLDQIKIDQSFVRDIATDNNDKTIVRTIIAMAHSLKLEVIAEGVETEEQRLFLLDSGCTHFQGYLFGKPMPIEQFEALLKQKRS